MTDTPPEVKVEPVTRSLWERMSIVWVVPLVALIIALGVAWNSYAERGPLIEIAFENGAGVTAGQTELRYRDVTVGLVEEVRFSSDLGLVLVRARVHKEVAEFIDEGAQFWVVRPEVSIQGVSGLDTVLSGVFVEGVWDSVKGEPQSEFTGLADKPLIQQGREGLQIALRSAANGVLTDNAPILYRGIEVGRIGTAQIPPTGDFAIAEAIIYSPHDRLISSTTRFWDVSGFTFELGPGGADVDFKTLASLISGGITFDTIVSGGSRVQDGTVFEVFPEEAQARASVFNATDVEQLKLSVVFSDNVAGLATGAPVELGGLKIGEVSSLTGVVDPELFGDARVRLNVTLSVQPARLGLPGEATQDSALLFLAGRVEQGLRARLANGSLLTGGLKVELIDVPDAEAESIDLEARPFPVLPSTDSEISDVAATAEGVFNRINNLPIEELLGSAIEFLQNATAVVSDPALREAPGAVTGLIGDVRGLVQSEPVQQVPAQLSAALARVEALLDRLDEQKAVDRLLAAVDAAATAADGVTSAAAEVPSLLDQIKAVAARAEALEVEELIAQISSLAENASAVLATEGARELPQALTVALREVTASLGELREGGVIENANKALASAAKAADQVAVSVADLPKLVERMTALLTQASATLRDYDGSSELNRSARGALRDIQKAADAVGSLARAIERNPNSLLLGR